MTVKVKAHPVYGREHAKGHDDLWCAQCASAWDGSDWAEQQAEARVKELEARLAAAQGRRMAALEACEHYTPTEAEAEIVRVRARVLEEHERGNEYRRLGEEANFKLEQVEAQIERVRNNWPHIELPAPLTGSGGRRTKIDPGAPTCLRCKIEELLRAMEGKP